MKKFCESFFRTRRILAAELIIIMLFAFVSLFSSCGCKHNNVELLYDSATCGNDGSKRYYCNDCGETFEEPSRATGEHDFSISLENKATCTESGYETLKCRKCSQTKEVWRSSIGHDYKGCMCKRCGRIANGFKEVKVKKSGDSFVYKYPEGSGLNAFAYLFDSNLNAVALFDVKVSFTARNVKMEVTQMQSASYSIRGLYTVDIYDAKNTCLGSISLYCSTTYSDYINSRETTHSLSRSLVDGETLYIKITSSK